MFFGRFSYMYSYYGIPHAHKMADCEKGVVCKVPTLVMIVDDHAVIRRMVRALFEAESLVVSDAVDGADGVQKAQVEKPDLIILDLPMPVMNGLDAARELKALMPHVSLVMFTNNAAGIVEKEARSAVISKSDSDGLKQLLACRKALLARREGRATRLLKGAPIPATEGRKI